MEKRNQTQNNLYKICYENLPFGWTLSLGILPKTIITVSQIQLFFTKYIFLITWTGRGMEHYQNDTPWLKCSWNLQKMTDRFWTLSDIKTNGIKFFLLRILFETYSKVKCLIVLLCKLPADNYLFKVNNRNTRKRC